MSKEYPDVCPNANEAQSLGKAGKRWKEVLAKQIIADSFGGGVADIIALLATKAELATVEGEVAYANSPGYYCEDIPWTADADEGRTVLASPNILWLNIAGKDHKLNEQVTFDIDDPASWDTKATLLERDTAYNLDDYVYETNGNDTYIYKCMTAGTTSTLTPTLPTTIDATYNDGSVVWKCVANYAAGANRAGKDFYLYALYNADGLEPSFVISNSGLAPDKIGDTPFRKIAGFHCLCATIGEDAPGGSDHALYGYEAGDILPMSVWDCWHRPVGDPEGYVYEPGHNIWVSIYGLSWTGSFANTPEDLQLVSVYGGEWADGTSTEKFHCSKFDQVLGRQHQRLLYKREFVNASIGSNQGTNIYGSADPGTTGGHKDTAGKRMVSNIGCEDMCGDHYQWGAEYGACSTSGSWGAGYDANDRYVGGQIYGTEYRVLLGGRWSSGAGCGSRCAEWDSGSLALSANYGARGASEPVHKNAGTYYA